MLTFADEHRAAEVHATLQRLSTGSLLAASDMVTVVRATDWHVLIRYAADLQADQERAAECWRAMLRSLLVTPGAGPSAAGPRPYQVDAQFAGELAAALPLGSSAVFLLVPHAALPRVLTDVGCFGGKLLRTPIAPAGPFGKHRQTGVAHERRA